jgi:hypothetical protein
MSNQFKRNIEYVGLGALAVAVGVIVATALPPVIMLPLMALAALYAAVRLILTKRRV